MNDVTILEPLSVFDAPAGSANCCLVRIYPAGGTNGLHQLNGVAVTLGRLASCGLEVSDDSVSRQHARLVPTPEGYRIEDLDSTNGTFVNDQRVSSQPLQAGDRIRIGNHIFKYLSADDIEAQYHETLYNMITTDGLTNAHNRQYLDETLRRELARSHRHCRPLALVMVDIDHFKRVNDTYGHLVGDEVLQEFARRIRCHLGNDEVFARYGGEEFAIVLGETLPEQARQLAEQLRQSIASPDFDTSGGAVAVTASFGLSSTHGGELVEVETLLEQADTQLYNAKHGGRNRVAG